ncbi:hypothetical protein EIB18_08155 [Caulobacter vibrioides]|uniref:hypothetical protein n=1 Tax=Caulobacter vibrioides TaxID=155892 RepID=UPI000BB46B5A|nr:hypothetical protein [Caulobacter vibrioides]ATC24538.1 hypothetical protein CA608_08430 [Caulobacter vibrioides]AZH12686.1 hypothetical protein EIB18_08155 [Caulobacter vibrioides]PLR15122.1 hypothetical protein CVUC_04025 [Caulobacter vibrioides]
MARLDITIGQIKAFGASRPVVFGALACALIGAMAGLAMQTGPQDGAFQPAMEPARAMSEAAPEPIAYPSGDLPDYVVGTDFLKATQSPPITYVADEPPLLPAPPQLPPHASARPGPVAPPPMTEGSRWASEHGDILDVSLPEDRAAAMDALMLADVAATGMTSR